MAGETHTFPDTPGEVVIPDQGYEKRLPRYPEESFMIDHRRILREQYLPIYGTFQRISINSTDPPSPGVG